MIQERSAGAILFYRFNKVIKYLVLHYPAGHWDFAKGNVEKGEDNITAAKREINEETGISDLLFFPEFNESIKYNYRRDGKLVEKRVVFFLAESTTDEVKLSFEHQGYAWLSYTQAFDKVKFNNAKITLNRAQKFLLNAYKKNGSQTKS